MKKSKEKKVGDKKLLPFALIVNKYGSGFFWYEETVPMTEDNRELFFREIDDNLG